ncbi:MAG: 6-carboxytetrahydropterin synthase [Saprospiraceae bacterium]|nr:6-carboxytetrahydropterin synthase [Saprospiraceae bacterium]
MKIAIFRKANFNAAHRLYNPDWTHDKNLEVFGVCTSPNFHGHNYDLVVKVVGEIDPETGMVINLKDLSRMIKDYVEDRFDHKNLNLDVEDFRTLNPTAENICFVIWNILREQLDEKYELTIRLYETPRNFVEYPA